MPKKAKYENVVDVTGVVNNIEYKSDKKIKGLGRIGLNADGKTVYVQMWEKTDKDKNPLSVVKNFLTNGVAEKDTINVSGELDERLYEGEYRRQVVNRMISKDEVYGIDKVDPENSIEFARVRLSGDVLEKEMKLVNKVRGEEVKEETHKLKLTVAIFNSWNPETRKEDAEPRDVLGREIARYSKYLEDNNKNNAKYKAMLKKLKDSDDINVFFEVLNSFISEEVRMFNITIIHVCAYGDMAEQIDKKVNKGDNITIGCDINTQRLTDDYGIIKGNLNEIEIMSFGGANVSRQLVEEEIDPDGNPW